MITLSMTAVMAYLRCPAKFRYRYVLGLEDRSDYVSEALTTGSLVHHYLEHELKKRQGREHEKLNWSTREGQVAMAYITERGFPEGEIIGIDDSFYWTHLARGISLRCTFDLVYSADGILTVRDYKTFSKETSFDIDLDFQGRFYLWVATQLWPGYKAYRFEHENIRSTPPFLPKDKAGKWWEPHECYTQQSMILSPEELADDGDEFWDILTELKSRINNGKRFYRVPIKGFDYNACGKCPVKNLCKTDRQGNLDDSTIAMIADKKDTIWELKEHK